MSGGVDITNINHVGMAVRDLAAAAARYEAMGFQLTPYSPHSAAWKPGDAVQPRRLPVQHAATDMKTRQMCEMRPFQRRRWR